jgi:integrase
MSPRYHEPYTLYVRKTKKGVKVWYYRTYDPNGRRIHGISTGKATSREAHEYCTALMRAGQLLPPPKEPKTASQVRRARRAPTLREWAEERNWWKWTDNGPLCEYCKGELKRSSAEAPAIQADHARKCARILNDNILPTIGDIRMDQVTPLDCEDLMGLWDEEGKANKTINNRASVARVMFKEAARLRAIPSSPWDDVKGYSVATVQKGILSLSEYKDLMTPATSSQIWASRPLMYIINLVASVTAMRQSEILALRPADIQPGYIIVSKKWNRTDGDGPQKTKRGTDTLPIPRLLYDVLKPLLAGSGYLFSADGGASPVEGPRTNEALKEALERIGIDEEKRAARRISFHSWRAFANAYFLRSGVSIGTVQKLTRHETEQMTEHYNPWSPEETQAIAEAQDAMVLHLGGQN